MKNHILSILFLLIFFNVSNVFGQDGQSALIVESINFNKIKIASEKREAFIAKFLQPFLSKNGAVRFDSNIQKFIFTDTNNRINLVRRFAEIIDNSEFHSSELLRKPDGNKKHISESVEIRYLHPVILCDVGEEYRIAIIALQEKILTRISNEIGIRVEVQTDYNDFGFQSGLLMSGTKKRIELAKKFVALLDQPILTEEKDF